MGDDHVSRSNTSRKKTQASLACISLDGSRNSNIDLLPAANVFVSISISRGHATIARPDSNRDRKINLGNEWGGGGGGGRSRDRG